MLHNVNNNADVVKGERTGAGLRRRVVVAAGRDGGGDDDGGNVVSRTVTRLFGKNAQRTRPKRIFACFPLVFISDRSSKAR